MKQKLLEALRKSDNRKLEGLWKQAKINQINAKSARRKA